MKNKIVNLESNLKNKDTYLEHELKNKDSLITALKKKIKELE